MEYTKEEIEAVEKTARSKGAIGKNAVVPRIALDFADKFLGKDSYILDFGSGKEARHTKDFREIGYNFTYAYDFNNSSPYSMKNPQAVKWDVIFASNVLNVQTSEGMLDRTLEYLKKLCNSHTTLIVNYPKSPRKLEVTLEQLKEKFNKYFNYSFQLDKKNHVFILNDPVKKMEKVVETY